LVTRHGVADDVFVDGELRFGKRANRQIVYRPGERAKFGEQPCDGERRNGAVKNLKTLALPCCVEKLLVCRVTSS